MPPSPLTVRALVVVAAPALGCPSAPAPADDTSAVDTAGDTADDTGPCTPPPDGTLTPGPWGDEWFSLTVHRGGMGFLCQDSSYANIGTTTVTDGGVDWAFEIKGVDTGGDVNDLGSGWLQGEVCGGRLTGTLRWTSRTYSVELVEGVDWGCTFPG